MFAGHYAAAFAGRAAGQIVPLWVLFVAVQFTDYLWAIFILVGIEKGVVTDGFADASHLDLVFMPYSHSLLGSVIWALLFAAAYLVLAKPNRRLAAGLLTGGAVLSHWFADLIVHLPDLTLWPGSERYGFGLWRSLFWSQLVEIGLLLAAFILMLRTTVARNAAGKVAPLVLIAVLLGMQLVSHLPAEELPTIEEFAVQALAAYTVLVLAAAGVDLTRRSR